VKAMAKTPADRFITAADMAYELREWLTCHRPRRRVFPAGAGVFTGVVMAIAALLIVVITIVLTGDNVRVSGSGGQNAERDQRLDGKPDPDPAGSEPQSGPLEPATAKHVTEQPTIRDSLEPSPKPYVEISPKPYAYMPGDPLGEMALVTRPAVLPGVQTWTVETISHRGAVSALAYSPDGRFLAAGSRDGVIRLWDAATESLARVLLGHDAQVSVVAWSPDGRYLASGSYDGIVRFWDVASGLSIQTLRTGGTVVRALAWSSDGRSIGVAYVGGGRGNRAANAELWKLLPDVKTVLRLPVFGHTVAWSADGRHLISNHFNNIVVWDAASGKAIGGHKTDGQIAALACSPEGLVVACAVGIVTKTPVELFDVESRKKSVLSLNRHHRPAALAWSRDATTLACGGGEFGRGEAFLWDVSTGNLSASLEFPGSLGIQSLALSPDGKTLAAGDRNGTVWLYSGGNINTILPCAGDLSSIAFSPRSNHLAYHQLNGRVRIWRLDSSAWPLSLNEFVSPDAGALTWSANGESLAGQFDDKLHIWNPAVRRREASFDVRPNCCFDLSPDGKHAVFRDVSRILKIADIARGRTRTLDSIARAHGVAWSPDGGTIAIALPDTVTLIDSASHVVIQTLAGSAKPGRLLAWSPDSAMLVVGSEEGVLSIWDVKSARVIHELQHPGEARLCSLRWVDDGRSLISVGGVSCKWNVQSGQQISTVETHGQTVSADGRLQAEQGESILRIRSLNNGRSLCTLLVLGQEHYAIINPEGHYRGSPQVDSRIVYVVQTDQSQQTLSPEEFSERYGWKNDPSKVNLDVDDSAELALPAH